MINNTFKFVKNLENEINFLLSSDSVELLNTFYERRFNVPKEVSTQYLKHRIALSYNMKYSKFNRYISLPYLLISIFKYLTLVVVFFIFSKKIKTKKQEFDLLVDDIQHDGEIERWYQLERKFGFKKTIYILKYDSIKSLNKNIIYQKKLKGYDRSLLLKNSFKIFVSDLIFLIRLSFKLNLNLVHLHSYFINDYFYFSSLFKFCSARYLIQGRNLGKSNALKNHLFKASGGIASSCIQKNIFQHDNQALFFDIDIFFSYGDKTSDDILSLGGRINFVVPVGSFAMDVDVASAGEVDTNISKLKASNELNNSNYRKSDEIDVLYIGINAITAKEKNDWAGYYKSIVWLAKLAKNFPNLWIFIKHHQSWISDQKELAIIKDSGIEYLDNDYDSYALAYKSSFILTYGSSMGYELTGHGFNVIFVNPNNDNPFINNFVYSDKNVANNYDDLELLILNSENIKQNQHSIKNSNYCYPELRASNRIYEYLYSYKASKIKKININY